MPAANINYEARAQLHLCGRQHRLSICLAALIGLVACDANDAQMPETEETDGQDQESNASESDDTNSNKSAESTTGDVTPSEQESTDSESDPSDTDSNESNSDTSDADGGSQNDSDTGDDPSLDEMIAELLAAQEIPVVPLERPDPPTSELYALGEALFFDPVLSGNKDIACATCHHPSLGSADGVHMSLGTGATGLGPPRQDGEHREYIARHSPTLYNVGDPSITNLFWDGRVQTSPDGSMTTPAGDQLPEGLDGVLAAQALFPLLDRLEMRGRAGDETVLGETNELAEFDDEARPEIWAAIMARLGGYSGYLELFAAAYPDQAFEDLTIAHAANAIAAYEREAFAFPDTRWDAYLRGELDALNEDEKWGAFHFYSDEAISGVCSRCHGGPLFSDQKFHDTGIPQLGPGHASSAPFDLGRAVVTGADEDRFRFRTPTLRNLSTSAPYMHNGSLTHLDAVISHYRGPGTTAGNFDTSALHADHMDSVQDGEAHLLERQMTLSELIAENVSFGALFNIRMFLETLEDPAVLELEELRPESVPSGFDVP